MFKQIKKNVETNRDKDIILICSIIFLNLIFVVTVTDFYQTIIKMK